MLKIDSSPSHNYSTKLKLYHKLVYLAVLQVTIKPSRRRRALKLAISLNSVVWRCDKAAHYIRTHKEAITTILKIYLLRYSGMPSITFSSAVFYRQGLAHERWDIQYTNMLFAGLLEYSPIETIYRIAC